MVLCGISVVVIVVLVDRNRPPNIPEINPKGKLLEPVQEEPVKTPTYLKTLESETENIVQLQSKLHKLVFYS